MSPRSFSPANVSLRVEKESLASDSSPVGDESCGHLEGDGPRRGIGEEWYRPIVGGPHTGRLADRYVLLGTGPYRSVRPCDYNQGLPYQVVRPCTGWYVPVRELISTLTASYQKRKIPHALLFIGSLARPVAHAIRRPCMEKDRGDVGSSNSARAGNRKVL
ncbi:hypothetical protein BHM03_00058014 [Ensete ventricosum]|nr:hypothetical protein BHM03_00058014 [Ensete ventricosum]